MTESKFGEFRPWMIVPITWLAFIGFELTMQAWLKWERPRAVLGIGLVVGAAVGVVVAALLRPVFRAREPSCIVAFSLAFVGVPIILGIAELLRGDVSGGMGTMAWGVPIALAGGVLAGLLSRRFQTSR